MTCAGGNMLMAIHPFVQFSLLIASISKKKLFELMLDHVWALCELQVPQKKKKKNPPIRFLKTRAQ